MTLFLAHLRSALRDPAGLLLALAAPPLVFLLFAALFGSSAKGDLDLRAALFDAAPTAASRQAVERLTEGFPGLEIVETDADLRARLLDGRSDVGLVLDASPTGEARVQVLATPGRLAAGRAAQAVAAARVAGPRAVAASDAVTLVGPPGDAQVLYYAGAVSFLFVVFSAMHGALDGLEDRRSGLTARLSLAAGLARVIGARAAWMTVLGFVQTLIVFALAVSEVELTLGVLAAWTVTAGLAAAAAAGLALGLISLCETRDQAQPISVVASLLTGAIGGSMAPRFLMPDTLRDLGWLTPHTWAIEAFHTVAWRGVVDRSVVLAWIVLAAIAATGLALAFIMERRRLAR